MGKDDIFETHVLELEKKMQHLELSLQLATFPGKRQCCFSSTPALGPALDNKKLIFEMKHGSGFLLPQAVSQFGSGPLVRF